jgi:hypothetical protein
LVGSSKTRIGGVAEQGAGQPEALAHAEREPSDPPPRSVGEVDLGQHGIDAGRRYAVRAGQHPEVVAGGAAGVKAGRLEHRTHGECGPAKLGIRNAVDQRLAASGVHQPQDHPQRRRLAGSVRTKESGDGAGLYLEAQIIDGGDRAEAFSHILN